MPFARVLPLLAFVASAHAAGTAPTLPGIGAAMQAFVDRQEISGAVTAVVTKDRLVHLQATGFADLAAQRPMQADSMFWIKSMTKPVTAVAVLMLQDDGRLEVDDPVAKYLPEFAGLKSPSGRPAGITIAQLLAHTSGLGEGRGENGGRTLAELVAQALASPMQFAPGTRWKYTQSGLNTAARIVEVVSSEPFEVFLEQRLFAPLGMRHTTFYPTTGQVPLVVTVYARDKATGLLHPAPPRADLSSHHRAPLGNAGLYSTAPDYARFCQMLLNGGELDGHRILKPETVKLLATPRTGTLKAGFVPGSAWALGVGVVTEPQGVTAMLSPGSFGHGGAFGTQAWIDPVRGVAYVLMIQRSNLNTSWRNNDDTAIRRDFQQLAVDALR